MFRCSPRPGTAEELSQARQLYFLCLLPFVFLSRTSARIFPSMLRIALHSPLQHINPVICRSGASKVCGKRSIRYWDAAKSALYLPLQQVLNPAQFSPRVMSSPASNAACSIAYFRFACSTFVGVLGFYASSASKGAPAHMTRFFWQNPFNRFTDFDVFSVWGAA